MVLNQKDKNYKQCSISVMDNIADPNIEFDKNGICNYYYEYIAAEKKYVTKGDDGEKKLDEVIARIKQEGAGRKYNCIIGLSGGADSTFLAWLAKSKNLNPLVVHFDYGWNSELAISNIENTVKILNFDLYTYVMDWEEFKDLQRCYFKASVIDLDVPADHMIFGALYKTANKFGIKNILSGNNVQTEYTLPSSWNYNKFDIVNLKHIHKQFGGRSLKHLPALGVWHLAYYQLVKNIKSVQLLNYLEYNRNCIKDIISRELNWRDYGGKHHESVFTRFYQGYILPQKFFIDKRKAHLSTLIFSGQMTKEEAMKELSEPTYDIHLQTEDKEYVAKKLDFSLKEFEALIKLPNRKHEEFGTDAKERSVYFKAMKALKPITRIIKKLR
jgi:N-acetyl sugar amidotransferase